MKNKNLPITKTPELQKIFATRMAKESEKNAPTAPTSEFTEAFVKRFTKEKLDQWKQEYGNRDLIQLKVDDSLAVLRPILADDLGEYMMSIGTNGMSKAVAFIIDQLWIDGDADLLIDEDKFIAIFLQVNNILEGKKAEFFRY
ncbi:hypothetical protein [Flavobacterium sp.]|uniref:hypothetical protein n=1 Tax=Flavobacterium sp. TaxID=239 RepID=UPI0026026DE7|nr:hypothetical protein [Flavobacterium sp.]